MRQLVVRLRLIVFFVPCSVDRKVPRAFFAGTMTGNRVFLTQPAADRRALLDGSQGEFLGAAKS
jgi:hypothetical protein